MTTRPRSEQSRAVPNTALLQSMVQQAQAATAAQVDSATTQRHEAVLQDIDLMTPGAAEDDIAPPAYGKIYGEIRDEKTGLGARITDDGRVNIRINQVNRRLSQIFSPALRQQVQTVQDSLPPPCPFIPSSLGGEKGAPPPPSLNIVIQVVGSRGDVQPFVALGKVLKDNYGHRVRLATHPNFKSFVQENGLEFFSIGGDPSRLMAFMVKNPGLMPGFRSLVSGDVGQRKRDVAEYIQGCWRSCYKADDGMDVCTADDDRSKFSGNDPDSEPATRPFVADCIIANPPSFAHVHCAEKLGIPLHIMFTMPYSPTQAYPHPLANIQSSNIDPQLTNYISYAMIEVLIWQGLGDIINRFRVKCLGLDPVSQIWAPGMLQRLKIPHTYCWSPALIAKPKDWGAHISISGFYFLDSASNYSPAPDLQEFLDTGPPPVYIGFGSIVLDDPNAMTELIFEAVRKTGQRVILSKGWGGIGANEFRIPNGVFMLGNVPHDWLFKHVSCVVHHGGAGTTAAGISAGRPTLVVPFFGDQPFWGAMVAKAGAGPDPIPYKELTADKLADAINFCLKPESLERAKELASKIAAERGSDTGAQSFHQYLDIDRLRCTLAPSRPAVWRIKRTQVRLSAFAACTLANANLVDFRDLKLYRSREYNTDEGPWDPISGFATSVFGAISTMTMGLADIPSETVKAVRLPFRSSRQQSQASVSTMAKKAEILNIREPLTPPIPTGQSRASSNIEESLPHIQSPPSLYDLSTPVSKTGLSSISDASQGRLNRGKDNASPSRVRSRNDTSSSKDYDMLRQTGAHTSKGFGRIVKAAVQSPMDISVSITEGFHNAPKLWGDDTVRPQQQITDFKSGATAVGKEFAFGLYDGFTGLVTQPWKGAQKEGTSGFFKGIGKGIGGFVAKPGAALFGIPSYMMKGVHKEVQKLFSSNVQSYIIATRTAQGYEEWLQSSDAEKQDVISSWKLIQKYLKKKSDPDEMVRDVLESHRNLGMTDKENRQSSTRRRSSAQSIDSADSPTRNGESLMLALHGSETILHPPNTRPEVSPGAADTIENIRVSVPETSFRDTEENANQENRSQLRRQRQENEHHQINNDNLRQAIAISEAEAQRNAHEALDHEEQLKRVIVQSLKDQGRRRSDSKSDSEFGLDDEGSEAFERARRQPENMAKKAVAIACSSPGGQASPSYDPGHLAGITQSEYEEQKQGQQGGKTAREKTEEEIVMEYVKKQSLLEQQHRSISTSRASLTEDEGDEDLQKALKLSMQGHKYNAEYLHGEASGT